MKRVAKFVVWLLVAVIVTISITNFVILVKVVHDQNNTVNESREKILDLEYEQRKLLEIIWDIRDRPEPTVYHGVDGVSVKGDKGDKGDAGKDGSNGIDGVNGLTPELNCNETKNRWEVRYGQEYNWEVLSGIPIKCTVTIGDILEALEGAEAL